MRALVILAFWLLSATSSLAQQVIDIPTRPGVTQRLLVLSPTNAKATLIMLPGGHGGLQLFANGGMKWGEGNFLVRTRQLFADQGFNVVVVDAPSDRQAPPFLGGLRQRQEHADDLKAVIAWARQTHKLPVWLVGTSRGTQSAGYVVTELPGADGPDGIVLTSTILSDPKGRAVPMMPLEKIRIPVLVVHHEEDGCSHCAFSGAASLIDKLTNAPRKQLLAFKGGRNIGDPCESQAFHGFNGIENEVVQQIAAWISSGGK